MFLDAAELTGDICVVSSYFNPQGLKSKKINFQKFRDSLKAQGARLAVIECVFRGMAPELEQKDCDHYFRIYGGDILWQKERLLNITVKKLPKSIDRIVFCDCDVIFRDNDWIRKAADLLNNYRVIQPFSFFVRLPKNTDTIDFDTCEFGTRESEKFYSFAFGYNLYKTPSLKFNYIGDPGFSWGFRRSLFEKFELFDSMIVGGGDSMMANAFVCKKTHDYISGFLTGHLLNEYAKWREKAYNAVQGSVGVLPGDLMHLWHGSVQNRKYVDRQRILSDENFDPKADIRCESLGPWYWNSRKQKLHQKVSRYFSIRREDGALF